MNEGPPAAPGRSCGACSLCCHMLAIAELDKPSNEWCKHCRPGHREGGCSIYQTRPQICRSYACGWLMSEAVAPEWYPLRSHMILSLAPINGVLTCTVTVDKRFPTMWKREPYYAQLKQMARNGLRVKSAEEILLVVARCNGRVWLLADEEDIDITHLWYIVKFSGSGAPAAVELFDAPEAALARLGALTNP